MRTVTLAVRITQKLEIFTQPLEEGYEIWIVGPSKVGRMVLTHYVTHDDLEARLEYARPHDLIWRESSVSEIPAAKHPSALEYEATIVRGKFIDREKKLGHSTATHLDLLNLLPLDRKAFTEAKKAIIGRWTDGVAEISFKPGSKLELSCPPSHRLNTIRRINGCDPDWWNFACWQLPLFNQEKKCGTRFSVIRVDAEELHMEGSECPDRIAHVFKRIGRFEEPTTPIPERSITKKRKVDPVAGIATPRLRRLEKAIFGRNPHLAERLNPGLTESAIRGALNRASVTGGVDLLVELYSWRNGTTLDERTPMEEASFFPVDIYQFRSTR